MSHGLRQTGQICTCGMLWCFDDSFQRVETQDEQENSAWWQCIIRTWMALKDDMKVHFLCWSSHLFFQFLRTEGIDLSSNGTSLSRECVKMKIWKNLPFSISLVVKSISFCWLSWSSRQTYACPKIAVDSADSCEFSEFWLRILGFPWSLAEVSTWQALACWFMPSAVQTGEMFLNAETKQIRCRDDTKTKLVTCTLRFSTSWYKKADESGECLQHVFNVLILFRCVDLEARGMPGQASQDAPLPTAASAKQRHRRGSRAESWKRCDDATTSNDTS